MNTVQKVAITMCLLLVSAIAVRDAFPPTPIGEYRERKLSDRHLILLTLKCCFNEEILSIN